MGMVVGLMVKWGMMLGAVVSKVQAPWCPVVLELLLQFSAAEPMELHVHRNCALWDNGVVGDTNSG